MYLGLTKHGIQLMMLFFLTFGISVSTEIELIAAFLPIIWFYSVFDVRSKASGEEPLIDSDLKIFSSIGYENNFTKTNTAYKYLGYGFIFLGIAALVNNIIFPIVGQYVDYQFIRFTRSAFTSLFFIVIGFVLLRSKNRAILEKGDENSWGEDE